MKTTNNTNTTNNQFINSILDCMEYVEGQNNLDETFVEVAIYEDYVLVESGCHNEYGGKYTNNNLQSIPLEELSEELQRDILTLQAIYGIDGKVLRFYLEEE